jgi:trimeric autotransporter adhesin
MSGTPNIFYFSDLHPSRITNLAADRANLHSIRAENVDIGTSIELPNGSLQIDTRGAGVPLTALPEAGALDDNTFQLRTLTAGDNMTFEVTDDNVTLHSAGGGGGGTTLTSAGGAETLVNDGVGPSLAIKGLTAGTGVTLGSDVTSITVNTTVTANQLGGGAEVVDSVAGATINFKTLVEGTNVTIDETSDTITINSAGGGGGGGITTITSGAGDESWVQTGSAPTATLKAMTAGNGVSLASDANEVVVTNSATIADSSVSGDASLVHTGTTPNYLLRRIAAGTGINVAEGADVVTITNAAAGTTPSLTALAGDEALVPASPQTTFNFTLKSLTAGAGISLASDADAVTITNSGVAQVYSLTDAAGATGQSLVAAPSPTANDFRLRRILAGDGMQVTTVGADVVVTYSGAATAVTLADSASGHVTWVVNGTGPNLTIKGMNTGTQRFVRPYFNANSVWVDNIAMRMLGSSGTAIPDGADGATATGASSMAFGVTAVANGDNATAVGSNASATANNSTAVGRSASAGGQFSVAAGNNANASNTDSTAIGRVATASGIRSTAIARSATASATNALAVGYLSVASSNNAQALGFNAVAAGADSKAIGTNVRSSAVGCAVIGVSDDNTVDLSYGAANSLVVANRSGGVSTLNAGFAPGCSALLRQFYFSDLVETNVNLTLSVFDIHGGVIRIIPGGGAFVNIRFPAQMDTELDSLHPWRTARQFGTSTFKIVNHTSGVAVTLNKGDVGPQVLWHGATDQILAAVPIRAVTIPAFTVLDVRWWHVIGGVPPYRACGSFSDLASTN